MTAIPAPEPGPTSTVSAGESLREWLASVLKILELKLRLLGFEGREAGVHLLILAVLIAGTVALFVGSLIFLAIFLLFLIIKITGWEWGWAALLVTVVLLVLSGVTAVLLRTRITKPLFTLTLAELRKDREWLRQTRESSR
ncbi:MAG: phage holin family protein [Verrucomicrobia bacterium]|nr:phage holin family protein [Verrucomicrobiota bacterium]